MADTKISGLPAVSTAVAAQEYAVNDAGVSRKVSGTQIQALLGSIKKRLSADSVSTSTTPAVVSGLDITLTPGTWAFQHYLRYRSTATGTGVKTGVQFSGTQTSFVGMQTWTQKGTNTGDTAKASQDGAIAVLLGAFPIRASGLTVTLVEVDTANADLMTMIEGVVVVTVSGSLQVLFASETGTSVSLMTDSVVIATQVL